ncbi:unnamed protein product [Effrenium voratum]|uniref:Aquaporin n=1 Tax=Effrenium voratum TaxID=2562239 RepID=A0AA36I4T5_9DINO|nr:unnamed protein product [Effrenium voratum]CAJ1456422.1 unnamed protein product [Effrenium voratum]
MSALGQRLAEFLGTLLLVISVECSTAAFGSPLFGGLAVAGMLFVAMQSWGRVSGGNFNPALTLALGCVQSMGGQGMDWAQVRSYVQLQLAAGIVGAFLTSQVFGIVMPIGDLLEHGLWALGVCEFLGTFMLCFVALNVCVGNRAEEYSALAVGLSLLAGFYSVGHVSGGIFNPAVALGMDLSSWRANYVGLSAYYMLFQFPAALCAALLFAKVRPELFTDAPREGPSLFSQLLGEFVGSFLVVLTAVGASQAGAAVAPLSVAAAVASLAFALQKVSGGHFNPAVSCALYLAGHSRQLLSYAVAQLGGAWLGALTATAIFHRPRSFGPRWPFGLQEAVVAEAIVGFLICFVVLAVKSRAEASQFSGLAYGFCMLAGFGICR